MTDDRVSAGLCSRDVCGSPIYELPESAIDDWSLGEQEWRYVCSGCHVSYVNKQWLDAGPVCFNCERGYNSINAGLSDEAQAQGDGRLVKLVGSARVACVACLVWLGRNDHKRGMYARDK